MIPRYKQIGAYNELECMPNGELCRWSDVEALIKERDELRARALAAVFLIPEDTPLRDLLQLREEARGVLLGKDKRIIAQLHDELRRAQEALLHVQRPPQPGVNAVYGVKTKYLEVANVKHVLMITRVQHASNGGLEIEVQLP